MDDILISRANTRELVGSCAVLVEDWPYLMLCDKLYRLRARAGYKPRFIGHIVGSLGRMTVEMSATGASPSMVNIAQGTILSMVAGFPPEDEQHTITNFLDRETAKLDTLIAKQERLIELLQEKRQALISHVVTKGLNPDAPMKDSGVEWLGAVPAHWAVQRNRILFREVDDRCETEDGELLTVSHLTGVTPRSEKNVAMFIAETLQGYKRCAQGDLVINTMWAWMGALGVSRYAGLVSPSYNVYRVRDCATLDPAYYELLCRISSHAVAIKSQSTGVWDSRLRLYPAAFLGISTCVPPLLEQRQICAYVTGECAKLDILNEKSRRSIDLMREHRAALISAAVTGKIDVREAA
jgi:type I restriction enzyme S subunit